MGGRLRVADVVDGANRPSVRRVQLLSVPKTTTINGHALSGNVTVTADDLASGDLGASGGAWVVQTIGGRPIPWDTSFGATVTTTDATVTTCGSVTPTDLNVVRIVAHIVATKSSHDAGAAYWITGVFRRSGGTVTQISSTTTIDVAEDDATWNATLDVSGTSVRVRVTGKAATTINWRTRGTVVAVT